MVQFHSPAVHLKGDLMQKFVRIGSRLINISELLMVDPYEEGEFNIYLSNGIILCIKDSPEMDAEALREKLEGLLLGSNIIKFKSEFDV